MNLTLTNNGPEAVTVSGIESPSVTLGESGLAGSRGGTAWTDVLNPGDPWETTGDDTVIVVGDKPSVREQIEQGLATATSAVKELYAAIRGRRKPVIEGEPPPEVTLLIANHGTNAVRVILGDGVTDMTVAPGTSMPCIAPGYLELRELGLLNESQRDGGTQPSSAA